MRPYPARRLTRLGVLIPILALTMLATACDDLLRVEDPVNLTPDDLSNGAPVSLTVNGARGSIQSVLDWYVLYTGLLTDEFVSSGTFPYNGEIDDRLIRENNEGLLGNLYTPLSTARFMADTAGALLDAAKDRPGVVEADRLAGQALVRFYGGYTRIMLAEAFCESAISAGPKLSSDERMQDALTVLQDAEALASQSGLNDLVAASRVGQARAQLWLGKYQEAATIAATVPDNFSFKSNYLASPIAQVNKAVRYTYALQEARRWTVGNGTVRFQAFEKWPYFAEWESIGLLESRPDLLSFNNEVPVVLQLKMPTGDSPIVMASTSEARLIQAEAALRAGNLGQAASFVNAMRASNWNLPALSFTGDLAPDLQAMARERSRELWLTGERIATARRYLEDGVDLFPTGKLGSATCFPVPQQEIDTNPNF